LVAAAAPAMVLGARHGQLVVDPGIDRALDRGIEARPARTALVLRGRGEERRATTGAHEQAASLLVGELAASGPPGRCLAKHPVGVGRKHLGPFLRASLDALVRVGKRRALRHEFAEVPGLVSSVVAHGCLATSGAIAMVTPTRALSG